MEESNDNSGCTTLAPVTHELKCWPEYFQAVTRMEKMFEVRKNDRNFKVGDIIVLLEWDPVKMEYTGKEWEGFITYVLPGGQFGIYKSHVVLGLL